MNWNPIISAVRAALPADAKKPALHEPWFRGNEWSYVKECIDTGWVSSAGKYVDLFERRIAEITGARHAVAVVNGTAALHICLKLAGVQPGDEVLMPSLTFIATANAVSYCDAIPHFVECENRTLGVDAGKLADYLAEISELRDGIRVNRLTNVPIRTVVPMHAFGHPVDMDPLNEVANRFQLTVVEDAAESLGSLYKGRHAGTLAPIAALSFNGNKLVTTGGGGAILTNDSDLARKAKHVTTTARIAHRWSFIHDEVGYNYRMPNLNAALGCAQLEGLPLFLESKRSLAERYRAAFADIQEARFFSEPEFARSNYWLNAILLSEDSMQSRDGLLDALNSSGIMARPVWTLMHRLPMYVDCPRMPLEVSESIERRLVNIPSSAFLGAGNASP